MARQLFIYWKTASATAVQAASATAQMQAVLRQLHPALLARLYQREGTREGMVTLMETYATAGGHLDPDLQSKIEARAATDLAAWCEGARHVEVFDELLP